MIIIGSKLKEGRLRVGLSQEELADKLGVSRSAVAKWETNRGLPDIENLKAIASLLDISIDYLISDGEAFETNVIKEKINIEDYKKHGKCRNREEAVVVEKYPNASKIFPLIRSKKLSILEHVLEWTIMPTFGIFEIVDQLNNMATYCLVENNGKQYLVCVDKEFIISIEIAKKIDTKRFTIGLNKFIKGGYSIEN